MKNKRIGTINSLIIVGSILIIGLFCYVLFFLNREKIYFKLVDNNIKLKIGSTRKLNYFLGDEDLEIEWSSNNDSVTVSDNGEITANDYGTAIITGKVKNQEVYFDTCEVTTYSGDVNISLKNIVLPGEYLLMKPNSNFDFSFAIEPNNAYITSINYSIGDENTAIIEDNKIISKNIGETSLVLNVNHQINKELLIKVSSEIEDNKLLPKITSASLGNEITMKKGETKELSLELEPIDGYVENVKWFSSDERIISVDKGIVNAKENGEAIIKAIINDLVEAKIKIVVNVDNADIIVSYYPKKLLKIGEKSIIRANATSNENISYKSINPSIVNTTNEIITGVSAGSTEVSLSINNGKTKTFAINVLPQNGTINGSANLWGYESLNDKIPFYADLAFFQQLAQKGIGLLQNNSYMISYENNNFVYDINSNILSVNNKLMKVRIFYPKDVDLSITNTLTFMGGRGETDFDGLFKKIKESPSIVKNPGILILVAEGNKNISFDGDVGAYATMFVKALTKQKNNVKNSILGFSDGAHKVMHASNKMVYDRIIVFSGYADGVTSLNNAKNSEIMFIIAPNDGNYSQAVNTLRNMKNSGYKNVTIISNGTEMSKNFADKFLVIVPGSLMKNAHDTINILNSKIISYAND